jgi:hypothetical protein
VPRLLLLIHRGERDSGGVINSADACPRKINSTDGVGSEKAAVWTCRAGAGGGRVVRGHGPVLFWL